MGKKDKKISANYLEKVPVKPQHINWSVEENGLVTLDIENKGIFNRIAQKLFKKPKISHIHLDEIGSFVWPLIDGKRDLLSLGKLVEKKFGEKAFPLNERLAKYFQILDSYGFVSWKE